MNLPDRVADNPAGANTTTLTASCRPNRHVRRIPRGGSERNRRDQDGPGYSEVAPAVCPRGHRLGPARMLLGITWTSHGRRRTWTRDTCGETVVDDGAVHGKETPSWAAGPLEVIKAKRYGYCWR